MSNCRASDEPCFYEIRVEMIDPKWSDWFDGFSIGPCRNREYLFWEPFPN